MWQIVIAICIVAVTALYLRVRHKMSFWRRKGVPQDPGCFPLGSQHSWDMLRMKKAYNQMTDHAYQRFPGAPIVGTYEIGGGPSLVIRDPDIAKLILVKDFDFFMEKKPEFIEIPYNPHSKNNRYLPLMLTELRGDKWKKVRATLSPLFTSGKLKLMVELMHKVADNCDGFLENNFGKEFEAMEFMKNYAMDIIISTGFGYESDSITKPDNIFKKHADLLVSKSFGWKDMIAFLVLMICPKLMRWLDLPLFFDQKGSQFFAALILKTVKERKENPGRKRNDLIDICVEIMDKEKIEDLNESEEESTAKIREMKDVIIANSLLMFFAGFDTVSIATSVMLYYLAKNQDCQEKLHQEIKEAVKATGTDRFDYATIMNLPYMEKFFQESLRMYPLIHFERTSVREYHIPGTDITIPKGIFVRVASPSMNKDEKYFPNPEVFDPENFTAERKATRHQYVSGGFGHGPRNCIGQRFATLEVKLVISRFLSKYRVVPSSKSADALVPDPKSRSMQPKGDIWISVEKR